MSEAAYLDLPHLAASTNDSHGKKGSVPFLPFAKGHDQAGYIDAN